MSQIYSLSAIPAEDINFFQKMIYSMDSMTLECQNTSPSTLQDDNMVLFLPQQLLLDCNNIDVPLPINYGDNKYKAWLSYTQGLLEVNYWKNKKEDIDLLMYPYTFKTIKADL